MTHPQPCLPPPSLRRGWAIFVSRSLSLVAALILGVVLSVISLGILFFPVIAAYYFAVRHSTRERFFIDLEALAQTVRRFLEGVRKHFLQSFVVGILGLLVPVALLLAPALLVELFGRDLLPLAVGLQVLFLPAFLCAGAAALYAYPFLVQTGDAPGALRYAIASGRRTPWRAHGRLKHTKGPP